MGQLKSGSTAGSYQIYTSNSSVYIGTTAIVLGRSSSSQTLSGISIDGNANTATIANTANTAPWSGISGKPSTVSGYGITDAITTSNYNSFSPTLTGSGATGSWNIIANPLPGTITYWPASTAPTGWLVRDGSAISRSVYSALFAIIGTSFGDGDGANTFNLPDDRGLIMSGYKAGDSAFGTFGSSVGSKDASVVSHTHTASSITSTSVSDPGHYHTGVPRNGGGFWSGNDSGQQIALYSSTDSNVTGISVSASTSTTINSTGVTATNANIQPSRIYLPIIKY